jgi:uncharacterized Fe-S cluster-containing radical SAM superfamily protein
MDQASHAQGTAPSLDKFVDPDITAAGEPRAWVAPSGLKTLWFNTGTLCNLTCTGCYIESSPRNDRLEYIRGDEVSRFLDEAAATHPELEEIGFTGGEPFMNPALPAMLEEAMSRGWRTLVLTNAMKPMRKRAEALLVLRGRYPRHLSLRVSLDHYTQEGHEAIRGRRSWRPTIEGLRWLSGHGFDLSVASRTVCAESEESLRSGYGRLFRELGIEIDVANPAQLVLFPEMDPGADVPEITESCWGKLRLNPASVMCASSRMVIKPKGADRPVVVSCTLLPYDQRFEMGTTLAEANRPVSLNHKYCAQFCVLGGASCSPEK